jgi:DNA replication and repair protein RecF
MRVRSLLLRQFRNHSLLELSVGPAVNLFLGMNGAGKTNIIEAIAVLATGLSPRGADTETMVSWGTDGFFIKADFENENLAQEPITLEMKYRVGSTRVIRQNENTPVKLRDLIGRVPLVSFVPEDLSLVKGEPDLRRRAVNMILAQINPRYAEALRRYQDATKARNAALRQCADGQLQTSDLDPWNRTVAEIGLFLCRERSKFINDFSERVNAVQARISADKEQVRIDYAPSFPGPWGEDATERWLAAFKRVEAQELAVGSTVIGPHRDDFHFLLNDRPARHFGSEGQKRTIAVSFKLAEIPFIEEKLGQRPICLLDDVLSELDANRAAHLLDELSKTGQCFVTMTGLESWPQGRELPATVFRVDAAGVHVSHSREGGNPDAEKNDGFPIETFGNDDVTAPAQMAF